jgi:hypothetical protein
MLNKQAPNHHHSQLALPNLFRYNVSIKTFASQYFVLERHLHGMSIAGIFIFS